VFQVLVQGCVQLSNVLVESLARTGCQGLVDCGEERVEDRVLVLHGGEERDLVELVSDGAVEPGPQVIVLDGVVDVELRFEVLPAGVHVGGAGFTCDCGHRGASDVAAQCVVSQVHHREVDLVGL
jgi:hypothetical protein